jgi:dihydroorotate dehydrogenase electron transfer subunit
LGRYFEAKVTGNNPLNNKTCILTIEPLGPVTSPGPGQFYMLEVGGSYDPLLKRPFSYLKQTADSISFLYAVRGKGTSLMKTFMEGKIIKIIGPLGNGYPLPPENCAPLLIAGGTGIASIYSLAEKLPTKACVFYGAKCKNELFVMDDLKNIGSESFICTDDGSCGEKGTTVEVLENYLIRTPKLETRNLIYACGPKPMLEAVSKIALEKGLKGYVSLEENMGCGFGACLGCAIKVRNKEQRAKGRKNKGTGAEFVYKRVCKEGPVFPIEDIIWET